jgi:hypothetical protein
VTLFRVQFYSGSVLDMFHWIVIYRFAFNGMLGLKKFENT